MAIRPTHYFTGATADRFLAEEPLALLVGFVLDQQVTVQKAFSGPLEIAPARARSTPATIAAPIPAALEAIFRERPAIHRFPGTWPGASRICAVIAEDYGGDAERVWTEAEDGGDLERRLLDLPASAP